MGRPIPIILLLHLDKVCNIRSEIAPEGRNIKSAVHQKLCGVYFPRLLMLIIAALLKTFQLYSVQEYAGFLENLYIFEERFTLVLCDKLPCVKAVVCKRIADAVIVAVSD